jgi:hypothetical protein
MRKKTISVIAILFLSTLILCTGYLGTAAAKEPSERFLGYNLERELWTTGNLGKAYFEGDFVSYQLRLDTSSKVWGAPEFSISYNFHQDSSDAIYIDGFDTSEDTGFQYSTEDYLTDAEEIPPPGWGTHIPTPEAGEIWVSGPQIINYMDAWPPSSGDGLPPGSDPADERYFTVKGLPWDTLGDHVILFYRAHLALDIIWSDGLEGDLPKVLDGDEFESWKAAHQGASFATGSSRHFYLQYPGIGGKTIPIPIAQYPSTTINGHKYVGGVPFDGWEITLTGELVLGLGLPTIPYNPPAVYTGATPWTTGYFEFNGLIEGSYKVQEEDRNGYVHVDIDSYGDGDNLMEDIPEGWASFDLAQGGAHTVDFYNLEYQDLIVSKDATPSWEQTWTWDVDKTAEPAASEIFVGDTQDIQYSVTVTATVASDLYGVSGTITVDNPNPAIVEVYATILDEVWDDGVMKGSQDITSGVPILIPSGVSTYPYSITLSDPVEAGVTYTNRVTVDVTSPVIETYVAEAQFSYTTPTEMFDESIDVVDDQYGPLGTVNYDESPHTFTYLRTFGPYSAVGSHEIDNTVTATGSDGGSWSDSASVTIDVKDITVSKDAAPWWVRQFYWTVDKSVEAAQQDPFINDEVEVKYTIDVYKYVDTDTFSVSGTVTIVNNNPDKDAEVYVVDKVYDGAVVVASQDLGSHTIAAGGSLTLPYDITFAAEEGVEYTNKAHVTLNNYHWDYMGSAIELIGSTEFAGSAVFTYVVPDVNINDSVDVTDVQTIPAGLELVSSDYPPGGWTTSADATFVVNKVVKAVELGTWVLSDTAYAAGDTETWDSGEKTLTFDVHDITVSKDAYPWWEREYDWAVDKSVSPTELTLLKGETGSVTYTITVTKYVAADRYKVYGTVTIVNNNPSESAVVHATDVVQLDGTVVASQDLGTHTIGPLGTLELPYEIDLPDAGAYTNWAYVDLENNLWKLDASKDYLYDTKFAGSAPFAFTEPTSYVDDTATVDEVETVPPEFSAVVDWGAYGAPPWYFSDSGSIVFTKHITEVSAQGCNWYDLPNTVTLTEDDTGQVRQDSALVQIHVVYLAGTIGYWRNHPDEWQDISPSDPFPWTTGIVAGYSYMEILNTEPAGDASIQLARQYIGAKLNLIAFGAPDYIADAIAEAEIFFLTWPAGSDPQGADRAYAVELAAIFEAYNSGGIHPP